MEMVVETGWYGEHIKHGMEENGLGSHERRHEEEAERGSYPRGRGKRDHQFGESELESI